LKPPLKIAVAGLGTVGAGVLKLIETNGALIESRCGRRLQVTAVSARDRSRDRGASVAGCRWFDDAVAMAREADAEAVVELIGGYGIAKQLVMEAIEAGKHVVTLLDAPPGMVVKGDTAKSVRSQKEGDEKQKEEALDEARKPEVCDEIRSNHEEIESEPEPVVVFL